MRPPMRGGRGGDSRGGRGGDSRGGRGGDSCGGGRSRGGGRGGGRMGGGGRSSFQRDEGPPAEIVEAGSVVHECESELVCRWILEDKIPYFNAGVYLENKRKIGKVDEILGKTSEVYFTVKMDPGVLSKSFLPKDLVYVGLDKLLPITRFTNPGPAGRTSSGRGGGAGGRGRSPGRGGPGGRGGRSPGGGRFSGGRMAGGRTFSRGGRMGGRGGR